MKNNSISIVLIVLAAVSIGCGMLGNLGGQPDKIYTPTNTNASEEQPVKPDFKAIQSKAEDLAKFSPPVRLDPKAKIKGKVAFVEKSVYATTFKIKGFNYEGTDYYQLDLDDYDLTKEQLATKEDEIDTLVQIRCDKGKSIGTYNVSDGRMLAAYAVNCKVSVIDYKTPAVTAQKTFSSRKLPKEIKVYGDEKEIMYGPYTEIKDYIESLSRGE